MKIEHVAIWTTDLEILKNYYKTFFNGASNQKYINPKTQFESYFVSFDSGARIELMTNPSIIRSNDKERAYGGLAHISFDAGSQANVDTKAEELRKAGYPIVRGPRITGDGHYEFEILDPDGNKIEVTTKIC